MRMETRTSTEKVFEAQGLGKTYEGAGEPVVAFQDVDLEIGRGGFVSLLGPSGCGKSTLLNLLSGLLQPSAGRLLFNGSPVEGPSTDLGMMFQTPVLFPWRTIRQNVMLSIEILGLERKPHEERAVRLLNAVGLGDFMDAYPNQLSGGMQQRAALCRVLVYEPNVLLLDEPFVTLDEFTREGMNLELLRLWEEHGFTIVMVTHNIGEAVFLSRKVVVMTPRPGRVIEVVDVPLPYPRTRDIMRHEAYADVVFQVRALLGVDH